MTKSRTDHRKRRRITWLMIVGLIGLVGAGYAVYTSSAAAEDTADTPSLQTTTVRRGDIRITAVGSGSLMPVAEVALGFRAGGTVDELAVSVGDVVETGQVVARLNDEAAQIQLAQAELSLEQAQAKLATLQRTVTQTVEIAEANWRAAQADYEAIQLASQHTGDRLTVARITLQQATEGLSLAQAAYDVAWDPGRDWELLIKNRVAALENERESTLRALEKAKDDLEIAQANYNLALLNVDDEVDAQAARAKALAAQQTLDDSRSGADVQAAAWAVEQAELALASAQLALESTVLRAPVSGPIVAISANVGEAVGTSPIMTQADLSSAQVRFYLEESDLGNVRVGNPVTVVFDALPDESAAGHVARVDPMLATVDGTPAIQAWASLDAIDDYGTLPIGLSAEVEVVAGEASKALLIPVQAIKELAPGQSAVFVVSEAGSLKLQPIEVGLRDFANAEVLSGLEQGDVISTGTVETE